MLNLALALCTLAPCPQDAPPELRDRSPDAPASKWDDLEGKPFPSLDGLDGWYNTRPLSWEYLRGYVVLVQYFSVHKKPAVRAIPEVVDLFLAHRSRGLVLLTIHAKRDAKDFQSFVIRHGLPHAVAVDVDGRLARKVGAKKVPTYHLVGRDGAVVIGGISGDSTALEHAVTEALDAPWTEPLAEISYAKRIWTDWRQTPPPPLSVGPEGWPVEPPKTLYARVDVRGKTAPRHGASHWISDPVDVRGRPHLYLVWGTNYSTSFPALPRMQALHEGFGPHLVVLGVSDQAPDKFANSERRPWNNKVRDFLATRPGLTYANVLDGEGVLKSALGVQGIPHALLVDSRGIGRWQGDPVSATFPLTDAIVRQTLMMDRLHVGGTSLTRDGPGCRLTSAPPGLRGLLLAISSPPSLLGKALAVGPGARPLGLTGIVSDRGELAVAGDLPVGSAISFLGWIPLRPSPYRGPLSVTTGG